jgi:hypothetical protein
MMRPLAVLGIGYLITMICSDLVLRGAKVQTRLVPVLLVYALSGTVLLAYLRVVNAAGVVAFGICWVGAFLSWFGVRSHIESSILLRMLCLLRERRKTASELIGEYESCYGPARRVQELQQAGLIARGAQGIELTPKGKLIARAAAWLQ